MILLLFVGYFVAYMILLMMVIAFMCGVIISFAAYVAAYYISYAWATVRHRSTPEWRYKRAKFVVDQDKLAEYSQLTGILTSVFLVLGFIIWAFSGSLPGALWSTGTLAAVTAFFVWDDKRSPKRFGDRPTYGQIKDKRGV